MPKNFEPLIRAVRFIVPGVMIATVAGYAMVKVGHPVALYPQADITAACQSVAGCKSASVKRGFDANTGAWSIKLMVVADRKAKANPIEEGMDKALAMRWDDQNSWTLAGWKTHKTEVRYE